MKKAGKGRQTNSDGLVSNNKKQIPQERLNHYHQLLEKSPHTVPEGIMPYKSWPDEKLVNEARITAQDGISLIMTDWKLYFEIRNRGLLPETYPADYSSP